jgi:hypothetical protein
MAWFKVDDGFTNSKPVLRIPRRYRLQAVGLWTMAGTWSAKEETDGFIPEYVLEELCGTSGIAGQLVQAGLWEIVNGSSSNPVGIVSASSKDPHLPGWVYRNWSKYQPTKAELEENREKERIRKANYRMSQRDINRTGAGRTEGHQRESEPPDPTRPDPTRPSEEEAKASSPEVEDRPDIDKVIQGFSELLKANDVKHKPGQSWHTATRLLIDKDGYTPEQILYVARFATTDEFWKSNILSIPKLREKFEALKIKAQAHNNPQPQRMDHSARARAKEADMLARFNAQNDQPFLEIEG